MTLLSPASAKTARAQLPPGPRSPFFIQMLRLIANPLAYLDDCTARYGETFTLRVLGPQSPPVTFFSRPESVQAIFTTLSDRFEYGKVTQVFLPLVGPESLIMQQGDRHRRQRKMLMPALHGEQLLGYGTLIRQIAAEAVADWQPGQVLQIRREMGEISLQVILRVVFGLEPGPRYEALRALLAGLLEAITSELYSVQFFLPPLQQNLGAWSPWGKFEAQRRRIDELIYEEIAERRQSEDQAPDPSTGKDVLSLLMAIEDEAGQGLSDQELRDQLMTLLLLGHETTASGLTWAFYWLTQYPEVEVELRRSLQALRGQDAIATAQDPYLTAVCQESLRINPIALISQPRRVKQTLKLEGYRFEPGSVLIPCIYTSHRRADTYPEPLRFNPDRFLAQKTGQKFDAAQYFPFGGGSRSCIGMALSMYEMKLILAEVMQRHRLTLQPGGSPVRPQRRGITFVPSENFRLKVVA